MEWTIVNVSSGRRLSDQIFLTEEDARTAIFRMGSSFYKLFRPNLETGDVRVRRMVNESLLKNDLEGILLPKISVDEYVPSDPNTDHVVIAFYLKGVPEAVYPFRNFAEKTHGVISVDYGDSETIPNTSIVYVEYNRDKVKLGDIDALMMQASLMAGIQPGDFMMTFPTTEKRFPYHSAIIAKYLEYRSRKANAIAQHRALEDRTKQLQQEIEDEMNQGNLGKMLNHGQDEGEFSGDQPDPEAQQALASTPPPAAPPPAPPPQAAPQAPPPGGQPGGQPAAQPPASPENINQLQQMQGNLANESRTVDHLVRLF